MNKLLIVCGPTATGKTSLALKLAKKFSGELISADSRQVYQGMDIGTGKDIPSKFKFQTSALKANKKSIRYYSDGTTKIWGYDLIKPNQDFSVAHFYKISWKIIKHLWNQNKLPIIVGGTGLYLKSLINPPSSLHITPDANLRKSLQKLSLEKLQKKLKNLNPHRFNQMNRSDKHNPRRLIRSIEIALISNHTHKKRANKPNTLWLGLKANLSELDQRINQRVKDRIKQGMTQEVKKLKPILKQKSLPASTAMGYKDWLAYLEGKISRAQAIAKWQASERQYARRQLTWFKKNRHIHWFDALGKNLFPSVVSTVKNWYS